MSSASQAQGTLLGLAVGDALGAPFEFGVDLATVREAVSSGLEMRGGGIWGPGEWTDDTTLALALAESIAEHGLLDISDLAERYIAWADSDPIDIGNITRAALQGARDHDDARNRAKRFHDQTGMTAGNGTVMRAAPIALAARSVEEAAEAARADAILTHYDPAAGSASAALCAALLAVMAREDPIQAAAAQVDKHDKLTEAVAAAERGDEEFFRALAPSREKGVCWTTLGVGLYAVAGSEGYEPAVTWAIGLGGDTDTNAAVTGALIGCRDGLESIPNRWLEPLRDRDRLEQAATALMNRGT
jgi:ADP-ribosylglycohydrolase